MSTPKKPTVISSGIALSTNLGPPCQSSVYPHDSMGGEGNTMLCQGGKGMGQENLPDVLTVTDVKGYLRIGKNHAYSLVNSEGFPRLKVGAVYRVPREALLRWLEREAQRSA